MNVNWGFCPSQTTHWIIEGDPQVSECNVWVYWIGGAIDFLFVVVGKTKGILFIELKLEFPIKTRSNSFPGV